MSESDLQRSNGEPEAVRRRDGGGETSPLPGSEAARDNAAPSNTSSGLANPAELWTPGSGGDGIVRPGSPADQAMAGTAPADAPAQPDNDPQAGSERMPNPAANQPKPDTGADASSHGTR